MEEKMKREFIQMLKEARGTDREWAVIMSMVEMLENDDEFERLAEIYKGKSEYRQFLTEKEAKKAVDSFVNYDGTRGPKWPMPQVVFDVVAQLGGRKEEVGKYNCWSLFAVMNMMHSDYGRTLMPMAQGEQYAKLCYMMAVDWLTDADHRNDVREHYDLE